MLCMCGNPEKAEQNKMVSNYLVRCPGLFDVKILGWFDRLHFLGLGCRLKRLYSTKWKWNSVLSR